MKQTFYSNGKLLLSGEYVVLNGAKSLAVPTKLGQWLTVHFTPKNGLHWTSLDADGSCWFETHIAWQELQNWKPNNDPSIRTTLLNILYQAKLLNPDFLSDASQGVAVSTALGFPRKWGLGTSSTLVNNIAHWAQVDAYRLLFASFGGSGYDIACAQHDTAVVYQLDNETPTANAVELHPQCQSHLYFVYLNQKQSSKEAIATYVKKQHRLQDHVHQISGITESLLADTRFENWAAQMQKHELLLSNVLEMQTIQEAYFSDFDGIIKSLGAWGGDFVLALCESDPRAYFIQKGYHTIFTYSDLIK